MSVHEAIVLFIKEKMSANNLNELPINDNQND